MSWLPMLATCSPDRRASLSMSGTALIRSSTLNSPDLYPYSPAEPAPAMVPPVARMGTFFSAALGAAPGAVEPLFLALEGVLAPPAPPACGSAEVAFVSGAAVEAFEHARMLIAPVRTVARTLFM